MKAKKISVLAKLNTAKAATDKANLLLSKRNSAKAKATKAKPVVQHKIIKPTIPASPISVAARLAIIKQSSRMGIGLQPEKLSALTAAVAGEAQTILDELAMSSLNVMVGANPIEILRPREKTLLKLVGTLFEKAAAANLEEIREIKETISVFSSKAIDSIEQTARKATEESAKIAEAQRIAAAKPTAPTYSRPFRQFGQFNKGGYKGGYNPAWKKKTEDQEQPARPAPRPFVAPRRYTKTATTATAETSPDNGVTFTPPPTA